MSALSTPQEPGTKGVSGCKQQHYLGWSRAVGSSGGAAPRHGSTKPACTGLGCQTPPPASCLTAPHLSFPGPEEQGAQHAFAAQTRCTFASCSHCCAGGIPQPALSSRRGICGICFPSEAQAKQSCCRTPRRIWFPSPHCKNLLLLSNTLLKIHSGLWGFCSVTLRIQPWLTMENTPGFGPPKSAFAGQTPPSSAPLQRGVSCRLCLQPHILLPLRGPQTLGSGLPPSPAPLTRPIERSPGVPQVFGPRVHKSQSSWGCSCFGSREKVSRS